MRVGLTVFRREETRPSITPLPCVLSLVSVKKRNGIDGFSQTTYFIKASAMKKFVTIYVRIRKLQGYLIDDISIVLMCWESFTCVVTWSQNIGCHYLKEPEVSF